MKFISGRLSAVSIESKHAYRFGYLKSEQWSNVRLEALAREGGKCQICKEESISNDAHHIWYPENIYETRAENLVILCRCCHDFVHSMMPDCKTRDEQEGRELWLKFSNAIFVWRSSKWSAEDFIAATSNNVPPSTLRKKLGEMGAELNKLRGAQPQIKEATQPSHPGAYADAFKTYNKRVNKLMSSMRELLSEFESNPQNK